MMLAIMIIVCMIFLISLFIFCAVVRNRNKYRPPVDMISWLTGELQQHAIEEVEKCKTWMDSHPLHKVKIIGRSKRNLVAMYVKDKDIHRWVILIHGYTGHKEEMFHNARYFIEQGYNVVIPDLQGHGESDGRIVYFGVREHVDLFDWMDWIEQHDAKAIIALFGVSMGATSAMIAVNRDDKKRIRCLIADSPYTTPYNQACNVMKMFHIRLEYFMPIVNIWASLFLGFSLKKVQTSTEINHMNIPVMFIMGTRDTYAPYKDQRSLYESCTCEKDIFEGIGAPHISSVYVDPQAYYDYIFDFLNKHLDRHERNEAAL